MMIQPLPLASRLSIRLVVVSLTALAIAAGESGRQPVRAQSVDNPISLENRKGIQDGVADWTEWDVSGAGDPTIQGFATNISVNVGETISFKVNTDSVNYQLVIYRLGYYGGAGARRVATVLPTATLPQTQPSCLTDSASGLYDCSNWAESAAWTVPSQAVSGIYLARLVRFDGTPGGASHIVFVVRDDARPADILVQTSDTTWQAYNRYGGGSLYCGGPISNADTEYAGACATRSAKVSYNRPFDTRGHDPQSWLFNAEYPMVRWLEANGYDAKYWSGIDTDRRGAQLGSPSMPRPKAFLSVGHDEYWSGGQRANVESLRGAGMHLAFFSGNEMFWKTRWENNLIFDPAAQTTKPGPTAYRTLVSYKETLRNATNNDPLDPLDSGAQPMTTSTWRDTRFGPPRDGGRPENAVTGNLWTVNSGTTALTVPVGMANLRFWRNTAVADLQPGQVATLGDAVVGYEWDEDLDNGSRPTGLVHLSSTTLSGVEKIFDFGATVGPGNATHTLTLYRHPSGALVFGAGTVQWSWGLDGDHDRGTSVPSQAIQQATVNLLADMGAQPASLQAGGDPNRPLGFATQSLDANPPSATITSPANGSKVQNGNRVIVEGTAVDDVGVVAGVEVSVDGATWHLADGGATRNASGTLVYSWSYNWSPAGVGPATVRARAIDDSGNIEADAAAAVVNVTVDPGSCPCDALWKPSTVPPVTEAVDRPVPLELGVKFYSDVDAVVTGIRFYKTAGNTGTHTGHLWSIDGTLLATATFTSETATGWQQVTFGSAVAIAPNRTYIASYYTEAGRYAVTPGFFLSGGIDSPPIHAPSSTVAGGNGVFSYSAGVPNQTFNGNNYWVDVVVDSRLIPLTVSGIAAGPIGADTTAAQIVWTTNRPVSSSSFELGTPTPFAMVVCTPSTTPACTTADTATAHRVTVTGLSSSSTYYFRINASDSFGNSVAAGPNHFITPGGVFIDTSSTESPNKEDFALGTLSGTYLTHTADGEISLAPEVNTDFGGTSLPPGWTDTIDPNRGASSVGGGYLTVNSAIAGTVKTYAPGRSLELYANFGGDPFEHAGFGIDYAGDFPWAIFSTGNGSFGRHLLARTRKNDGTMLDTEIAIDLVGSWHRYRIQWDADQVSYFVDGTQVVTHAANVFGPMRPAISDYPAGGPALVVDWIRMIGPYAAATGTFESRVFDTATLFNGGQKVNWNGFSATTQTPAGTSVAFETRSSDNGTWSPWAAVSNGTIASPAGDKLQYRATLTTPDLNQSPIVEQVAIGWNLPPTRTPTVTWTSPKTAIVYGTALGSSQLDATADTPGTLAYTPAAGSVLNAGAAQHLAVAFTPYDLANYLSAAAAATIDVNPAPLSVVAASATRTYKTPNPALTGTLTGLQNGDQITATYSTTAGADSPAGTYPITPTLNDPANRLPNYILTTTNGTLTITRATPSISWSPVGLTYGTALGTAQLNASASVPGTFTYTPAAGAVLNAGSNQTLSVTFTPADTANYTSQTATASIDVARAPLTVTANNASKAYGDAIPALTAAYSGFVNGDSPAVLGGTLSLSTTATDTSAVGSYSITPSGLTAANYTIQYVDGTLTVSKRPASVTPNAASKSYGSPDPMLTGSLSGFLASDNVTATYARTPGETVAGGPYTISASLSPAAALANYAVTYNTATFTITKAQTTTSRPVSSLNPSTFPQIVTLTAGVTSSAGTPTGTIQFLDGGVSIGIVALTNGTGSLTTGALSVGTHAITATYIGSDNLASSSSAPLTQVVNPPVPPTVAPTTLSAEYVKINTSVTATATFSDTAGDTHTAQWNWGDGTTSAGTVNETTGTVTGSHSYTAAGMYAVTLTVTDETNLSSQTVYHQVAVYDPAAGWETGAGSYASPAGSYTANLSLAGTATITQLTAKYGTDGTLSAFSNVFKFSYSTGGVSFQSTSMKYLVMTADGKSWLKGEGNYTVGGVTETCYFLLAVVNSTNTAVADKVRVKLWNKMTGAVRYDNQKINGTSDLDDAAAVVSASTGSNTITFNK